MVCRLNRKGRFALKIGALILGLVAAYVLLLTLCYLVDVPSIQTHGEQSLYLLRMEGTHPTTYFIEYEFPYARKMRVDNTTDATMVERAMQPGGVHLSPSLWTWWIMLGIGMGTPFGYARCWR